MSSSHSRPHLVQRSPLQAIGPPALVTIDDVAERLGVSVRHVRRLVFERRIPYVKWGHLLRFDLDDIKAWLTDVSVHPADDSTDTGRP